MYKWKKWKSCFSREHFIIIYEDCEMWILWSVIAPLESSKKQVGKIHEQGHNVNNNKFGISPKSTKKWVLVIGVSHQ